MNILIVASECVPYAKTGGLADVVGVLPKFLKKLGHDVRVVMPRYYVVDKEKFGLKPISGALGVPMGIIGEQWCGIYESCLPNSDVPIYFLEHELYYGRAELYNVGGKGFIDNDNRFVFLSRAALQLAKKLDFKPDIVHANDWHTAIMSMFLKTVYKDDHFFAKTASVLTIHNMQYQGVFYAGLMDVLGIGWENWLDVEWMGQVNLLKGGIYAADMVNTVSEGYLQEIKTPEYGYTLDGVMRDKGSSALGIINGMDYDEWNSEKDKFIAAPFSESDLSGKAICKKTLQEKFNLPVKNVPVLGIISRLVEQKGIDIIIEALPAILSLDIQMVVLGEGEPLAHEVFLKAAKDYPEKFACKIGYDHALSHQIEAGSDFFIMPSRFEPCGLNQMYSLRYGTPPIVRATGGLNDSVDNYDEAANSGDGFKFYSLTSQALYDTVGWAVWMYYNTPDKLKELRIRGMKKRFTWEKSAIRYEEMYEQALIKHYHINQNI